MYEDVRWAARLADVPGVGFAGSPGIERSRLQGHALKPRKEDGFLMWAIKDGWTSQAPAAAHRPERDLKPATLIRRTWECLELPGTAPDWHYTLQRAAEQLWRLGWRAPEYLGVCEEFCRIDLSLVRRGPNRSGSVTTPSRDSSALRRSGSS